jgi:hypothetical protein
VAKHFASFFFQTGNGIINNLPAAKHSWFIPLHSKMVSGGKTLFYLRDKRENIHFCSHSIPVAKHLWQNILFAFKLILPGGGYSNRKWK